MKENEEGKKLDIYPEWPYGFLTLVFLLRILWVIGLCEGVI